MRKCNSLSFGKSVRIFPLRLIFVSIIVMLLYIGVLISSDSSVQDKLIKSNPEKDYDVLKQSQLIISILTDDKVQINGTNGSDMKLELSNFLLNMNSRIKNLETKIKNLEGEIHERSVALQSYTKPEPPLSSSDCTIPSFEGYSFCESKIGWMRQKWNSDPCYAEFGVDGSDCSIIRYLAEVEGFCPLITDYKDAPTPPMIKEPEKPPLKIREDFEELYRMFGDDFHYKWIGQRIRRMETKWIDAAKELSSKPFFENFKQKKILIHPGLLADEVGWEIPKNAFKGGPLGELVQWSDIIAASYVLGHDITLVYSSMELKKLIEPYLGTVKSINCPIRKKLFDVMYCDISAVKMLKRITGPKFRLLHCELRVVDSFGTEPEYNHPPYAARRKKVSDWGKWDLYPKQFNTMFPHTPDNTFLGFVIETIPSVDNATVAKEDIALVYGKRSIFWKDKSAYLDAIQEVVPLHGTVASGEESTTHVPPYVINHGVLPGEELHALLRSSKIFVGMGFPYEGPAPLEAIADGGVFLNPVFEKNSFQATEVDNFYKEEKLYPAFFVGEISLNENEKFSPPGGACCFLIGQFVLWCLPTKKPTSRRLSSQHPYAENFIGAPHVRMVNMNDPSSVKKVIQDILSSPPVKSYMPYEFTALGMLERVAFLLEKQEFCDKRKSWPPLSSMQVVVSDETSTCSSACAAKGLMCEPHFFRDLNQRSTFKMLNLECENFSSPRGDVEEIDYPSYNDKTCYIQGNFKLFSCAGRYTKTRRICPCRDYVKGQVALCKDCFIS